MNNFGSKLRKFLPWFLLAELVSYLGYYWPMINALGFISCLLIAAYFAWKNIDYLLAFVLAELVIGSKGHLFIFHVGSIALSVRMMLWLALLLGWLAIALTKVYKSRHKKTALAENFLPRGIRIFLPLLFFVAFGIVIGLLNGNAIGNIYADANAWLYFLLAWPLSYVTKSLDDGKKKLFVGVLTAAVAWLIIKTWLILYFFSHDFIIIGDFYKWVRDSGVGEITAMNGAFYRIFIQSHVYPLMALVIIWYFLARLIFKSDNLRALVNDKFFISLIGISGALLSVILIGLSRSFWVGLLCALFSISCIFINQRKQNIFLKIKKYSFYYLSLAASLIISLFIILLIIRIPIPRNTMEFDATSVLSERVTETNESAIGSRWAMLPILAKAISRDMFLGHGFGSTLTYRSQDPRVVASTGGANTTYAFEWGWLDMWFKFGLFGLLAYFYLLNELWMMAGNDYKWPIRLALITLVSLHVFTPYLNHPLGIGVLLVIYLAEFDMAGGLPNTLKNYILHFINFKPSKI